MEKCYKVVIKINQAYSSTSNMLNFFIEFDGLTNSSGDNRLISEVSKSDRSSGSGLKSQLTCISAEG